MQWSDLVTALGSLLQYPITNAASATPSTSTDFNNILPRITEYAEQRIIRDLDFLFTRQSIFANGTQANQRTFPLPASTMVLEGVNIITNPTPINTSNQTVEESAFVEFFLGDGNGDVIEFLDESPNTPNITVGQWVNVLTAIGSEGEAPQLIFQGPLQITAINSNFSGENLDFYVPLPGGASTGNLAQTAGEYIYNMMAGSNVVTVTMLGALHNYAVGDVITVGVTTKLTDGLGHYLTLPAGNYTITSVISVSQFTFNHTQISLYDNMGAQDNNGNIALQYLAYPISGTRNRVQLVSKDMLDIVSPTDLTSQGVPQYGAILDGATIMYGNVPDQNYIAEFIGKFRPKPISASNPTSYLATYYPDFFLAACMIFATGFQRDFGAQSDDPKMAQSWEAQYQVLKPGVIAEEQRRKGWATGWSQFSQPTAAPAQPGR